MTDPSSMIGYEMSGDEKETYLNERGHGVLSLGTDNRGYGIPISFGYDRQTSRIVLEFVNNPESKKREFAETTEEATLTVYEYGSIDSWASVVVTGTLHRLDEGDVSDRFAALFFANADDAVGRQRWLDFDDLEREWYEIRITEISGRHSGALPVSDSV